MQFTARPAAMQTMQEPNMKLSKLIADLQSEHDSRGDVEVKLDIDGFDCNPTVEWYEPKGLVYLW